MNITDEVVNASATILANILLDFVKSGGNANDLTPSKIFGNGSKQ